MLIGEDEQDVGLQRTLAHTVRIHGGKAGIQLYGHFMEPGGGNGVLVGGFVAHAIEPALVVVLFAALLVGEYGVGLGHFFELGLCKGAARVLIGVVAQGQLAVSLLYVGGGG